MIREAFDYLLTPATRQSRKLGYVYSSIAMERRYSRCRKAWASHIDHCHRFILSQWPDRVSRCVVFGSGLTVELPLSAMLERCEKLILVDLIHPRTVRRMARGDSRLELVSLDVSGFADWISQAQKGASRPVDFRPPSWTTSADLTISANLLSQLSLEPLAHIQKITLNHFCWNDGMETKANSAEFETRFVAKIQRDHGEWLAQMPGKKILFTDILRDYRDRSGTVIETAQSVYPLLGWTEQERWIWQIAPLGEESRDYSIDMTVAAYTV